MLGLGRTRFFMTAPRRVGGRRSRIAAASSVLHSVVGAMGIKTIRPRTETSRFAPHLGNVHDQRQQHLYVGQVAEDCTCSGVPLPSVSTWCLLRGLAPSVGFGPVLSPPPTALTDPLSTAARIQSIWSGPPSDDYGM